jgi:hypothetical protein
MMLGFDDACYRFTQACSAAAQWKQIYLGAAYSTRLRQAIADLEVEIGLMRAVLDKDEADGRAALAKFTASAS